MFDNNIDIWKRRGHWYNIKITSTGKSIKLVSDPLGCVLKTGVIKLPPHYIILDVKAAIKNTGASKVSVSVNYYDEYVQGVVLPDKTSFDSAELWIFAYKDGA